MKDSLRYALIYLVIGSLWIVLSDNLLFTSADSSGEIIKISTGKGLLFVLISSGLVFYLIYQARKRVDFEKKEIEKREAYLRQISTTTQREYCLVDKNGQVFFRNEILIPKSRLPVHLTDMLNDFLKDERLAKELTDLFQQCLNSGEELERDVLDTSSFLTFTYLPLDQELEEIILIIEDKTSTRLQMKEQHLNSEMLELILNSEEIGLYDWNLVTNATKSNETLMNLIGAKTYEEIPDNAEWLQRVHPDDRPTSELAFRNHLEGLTDSYESQYRFKTLDDDYKWLIEYAKVTERNDQGEPLHLMGVVIDFDSFKKNEDRVIQQSELLEEIAHNNSHAVRGPLARILGLIQLLDQFDLNGGEIQAERLDILKKIKVSAEELDLVIQNLAGKLNKDQSEHP